MQRRWRRMAAVSAVGLATLGSMEREADAAIPFDLELTPGELRGIAWEVGDAWPSAYFEYLPSNFEMVPPDHLYPLLVTLGGIGTMDDPSNCPGNADWCTVAECEAPPGDPDGVCRVYRRGPAVEIRQGVWDDVARPFIVIQPQNSAPTFSSVDYDRDVVDDLVQFVVDNYPVDPRRIYLLGNSQGGRAVLQYTSVYSRRMAAVTMGPGGQVNTLDAACRFQDTAFWAFHGENDDDANIGVGVFDPCWVVQQIRMANHPDEFPGEPGCVDRVGTVFPEARMTMFENTNHNAWTPAYEDVATGFARPTWTMDQMCGFEANFYGYTPMMEADGVYTWLLAHDRPDTDAGDDFAVPGDQTEFVLEATTLDDDPVSYTWTQIDGPPVTLTDADQAIATVSEFEYDRSYTFEVLAIDADQQWDIDEVVVTVEVEIPPMGSTGGTEGDSGSSGDGGADGDGGTTTGEPPAGSTSSASGPASTSASDGGPPPGVDTATGGGDAGDSSGGSGSAGGANGDSGCACAAQGGPAGATWLGLLGVLALGRRRRDPA